MTKAQDVYTVTDLTELRYRAYKAEERLDNAHDTLDMLNIPRVLQGQTLTVTSMFVKAGGRRRVKVYRVKT